MKKNNPILEYFTLFGINLKVKFKNFIEYMKVIFFYYPNLHFAKIDVCLLLSYLFQNPFRMNKDFLIKKGVEDIYTYGETPLTTLDLIVRQCGITAKDTVFELGCGRGRTCFWLNQWIGCKSVGIDWNPIFIEKAQTIKEKFSLSEVVFRHENLFQADLKEATVIYLYGSCFSEEEVEMLIDRFRKLPQETKIITVSYDLTSMKKENPFHLIKEFSAPFTWGQAQVYLHLKT